ncbi:MAG: MMPL family transporter [Myxococcales bacterium]|nr:MMPL family transporter [Myxococcales bacterium]
MTEFGHTVIDWAIDRPRRVVSLMLATTLLIVISATAPTLIPGGLGPLSTIAVDVDPENMLEADEPVRVFHNERKRRFGLHDAIVVGVVNEADPQGIFNSKTLAALHRLTEVAQGIEGVVASDVLSLATIDSIESTAPGTVSFDWMMPGPPADDAAAAAIRARAERIPFLRDTLFSDDGQAAVIYVPLASKAYAHDVAAAIQAEIDALATETGAYHIAGLPVAEETFGIEMFVQMAISAPAAMLLIFFLLWVFFRRMVVIVSPMIVALVAVLGTMGLLVITGNTIHIMSSMIPIFIMPIAVLDAVHIISDFFDRYDPKEDRKEVIRAVMRHLFTPMLFTSLTTAAGFASLALTPIPPVRVFGVFVAIGVLLAWLWTILFVPAYLATLSEARLAGFGRRQRLAGAGGEAHGLLRRLDAVTYRNARWVVAAALLTTGVAAYGISKIRINDNPTRWFESEHPIRIADRELNEHFGGTYDAFLVLEHAPPKFTARSYGRMMTERAKEFRDELSRTMAELAGDVARGVPGSPVDLIEQHERRLRTRRRDARSEPERASTEAALEVLEEAYSEADGDAPPLAEGYPQALSARIRARAADVDAGFVALERAISEVVGDAPTDAAAMRAGISERLGPEHPGLRPALHLLAFTAQAAEVFKRPALLQYLEGLQAHLGATEVVGKSSSLADIVKTVHRDLLGGREVDYRIPESPTVVAQTLEQYLSSHRKDDLWHFVTPDYQDAVLWLQLKSGDNKDMEAVVKAAEAYVAANPAPISLRRARWFGLTYINVVWQDQMVSGMLNAFLGSFVIVLLMMILLFRSVLWGLLSMLPLTVTVAVIYGAVGLMGKDYDMPVAVLSSLSLGLAVDYAIHFLARSRELVALHGSWERARGLVFGEPARAISRNIVVVGMGFLPLLLAPLVPYQTVGYLIAAILVFAGGASLVVLPSLVKLMQRRLF